MFVRYIMITQLGVELIAVYLSVITALITAK